MKTIMIVCSTKFYDKIKPISDKLLSYNYNVIYPNCYNSDNMNDDNSNLTDEEYISFYKEMYKKSQNKISNIDELLVLNYDKEKNGKIDKNYIGASTFLEMYESFMQNKKIYIYNELPSINSILYDDIKGMNPTLLYGNINNIVSNK